MKTVTYSDEPLEGYLVDDFLPSPESLVLREKNEKITISLSKRSVDYFKKLASKHNLSYQKMIRNLLDDYAQKHG